MRKPLVPLLAVACFGAIVLWIGRDSAARSVDVVVIESADAAGDDAVEDVDEDLDNGAEDLAPSVGEGSSPSSGPFDLVDLRSGVGGVDLRIHRRVDGSSVCGLDAVVRVGVSTEVAVGAIEVAVPTGVDGLHIVSSVVGEPEGDLVQVLVVRVPLDVVEVIATFAGGAADFAVPVDGITAVALRLDGAEPGGVDVEVLDADGDSTVHRLVVERATVTNAAVCPSPTEPVPTVVAPPPVYPVVSGPAGAAASPLAGDRPDDRAAVVAVYEFWYNGDGTDAEKAAALDDPDGVVEAQLAVDAIYGPTIAAAVAFVDTISFVGEDEAAVGFHIDVLGSTMFTEQGRAVLIDGSWRITRDTVCPLIARGGGVC